MRKINIFKKNDAKNAASFSGNTSVDSSESVKFNSFISGNLELVDRMKQMDSRRLKKEKRGAVLDLVLFSLLLLTNIGFALTYPFGLVVGVLYVSVSFIAVFSIFEAMSTMRAIGKVNSL